MSHNEEAIWVHFWQTTPLLYWFLYLYITLCQVFCFVGIYYVLVLVSIIFWKLVVSIKLLMLPFVSGMIGSSGENLHSPSTINLYLNKQKLTDADLEAIALYLNIYNCNHKFISLLLKRDCLLPFVEWTRQQNLVPSIIPCKSCKDIWLLHLLFFGDLATAIDFATFDFGYPEEFTKLTVLFTPLILLKDPFEPLFPINL
jgi:hypothetical protein